MMAKYAILKVKRVRDSGQWCAELDAFYSHIWVYGMSPSDALWKLTQHNAMQECYRARTEEAISRYNLGFGPLTLAHFLWGVNLATIVPGEG
jgi:hypothetical protein